MWQSGPCNMVLLVLSFILSIALALPNQDTHSPAARPSCIKMTPEKEQQIDEIVEKLGHFLANLTIEHEHFDIRLIKLSIEQHSEKEIEEKETVLQLSVNDCELTDDELEEIDHHREKAKQHEQERQNKKEEENEDKEKLVEDSKPNFKVMNLELDRNGQELVELMDKKQPKRPLLVYVQKDHGQLDYLLYKRR